MKLRDTILLSLSVAFLIIGIHQTMTLGFARAYWALMLALVLFFGYSLSKGTRAETPQNEEKLPNAKGRKNSRGKKKR